MGLADLFFGNEFKRTIKRYCGEQRWAIADLRDEAAALKFDMRSGRVQTVYIIKYGSTLEFSCPSGVWANSPDSFPHRGSTELLLRNRDRKIGFWCIERIGTRYVYLYMHNAEMSLIDSRYFRQVVEAVIQECDRFEDEVST